MKRNVEQGFVAFTGNPEFAAQTVGHFVESRPEIKTAVVVYAGRFTAPEMVTAIQGAVGCASHAVLFEDFGSAETSDLMTGIPVDRLLLIAVDLCRMVSNKLDARLDKIQVRQKAAAKICIDPLPYIARPWQVYFPYSLLNKTWLGYNHSFAIEGEWKKFKDGLRDDPCDVNLIAPQIAPATFIDYCCHFDRPLEVYTEPVSERVQAEYEKYKASLFETETGVASLLAKLHKFVQGWCPQRTIPLDLKKLYQPGFGRIVKTDLPLDDYLYKEMMAIINHTNALTRSLYDAQDNL